MADKHSILFALGRPLSPLYSLLMRLRAWLYANGVLKSTRLPVPVICVGNLTLGGTGKTPMVMHVVKTIMAAGKRPAVVSRGYGGRAKATVNVVADGENILLSSRQAGDEPRLIAESLPGVPVLTGTERARVGEKALELFAPDIIVLDDGFQHLALQRDIDIVLFNGLTLLADRRVFPGGILREPLAALHRARCFMITGVNAANQARLAEFKAFLRENFPAKPIFTAVYKAVALVDRDGKNIDLSAWRSRKSLAFCGLAEPDSFRKTLELTKLPLTDFAVFADHYRYTTADLQRLTEQATKSGAQALFTTEKDMVKLTGLQTKLPLFALQVRLVPDKKFATFLTDLI